MHTVMYVMLLVHKLALIISLCLINHSIQCLRKVFHGKEQDTVAVDGMWNQSYFQ